jgi:5'-3' exonuclease
MTYKHLLNKIQQKETRKLNDHVLLIDSMNMFIRNFATVRTMDPSGNHVGGIHGFLKSLGAMVRLFDPTRVICVFDGKGSTVNRKAIDPNYKAQRVHSRITHWGLFETKEEEVSSIQDQVGRLQDYLKCLPVSSIEVEKLEADDIIAFLSQEYSNRDKKVTIVSSDKDFLQLIRPNIEVYNPLKKEIIDTRNILDVLQVHPKNYNIVKAIVGDTSDNLRGVKGVGLKTLLKEFPELAVNKDLTLEDLYKISEERLDGKQFYAKLIHEWHLVERNMSLMDLQETMLSEWDIQQVIQTLSEPNIKLHSGAFLRLLEVDQVQGPSSHPEPWLEVFRDLDLYIKNK